MFPDVLESLERVTLSTMSKEVTMSSWSSKLNVNSELGWKIPAPAGRHDGKIIVPRQHEVLCVTSYTQIYVAFIGYVSVVMCQRTSTIGFLTVLYLIHAYPGLLIQCDSFQSII